METRALAVVFALAVIVLFLLWLAAHIAGKTTSSPPHSPPARDNHPQRIVIHPVARPYHELQHWEVNGDRLVGFYRTPYGSYEGYIRNWRTHAPAFYIINPPQQLRYHPHWVCFTHIGRGRYLIHFYPHPKNPDAGILETEKVLAEALSGQRRKDD